MRLYLDTNILVFLATGEEDEINADVEELLNDYENHLLTSTVCVHELIHLFQIGKIHTSRNGRISDASEFESWLSDMGIEVIPVTVKNLKEYAKLPCLVTIVTLTTDSSLPRQSVTVFRSSVQTGSSRNMRDMASTLYLMKDRYGNSGFSSYDSNTMYCGPYLVENSEG